MNASIRCAGALLGIALAASIASAQTYCSPVFHVPLRPAPDACGPGYYAANANGMVYGPNYWVRPPWEPFNGPMFNVGQGNISPTFPSHPYVRSPRDFFMWRDNMEDQMRREQRPVLIP